MGSVTAQARWIPPPESVTIDVPDRRARRPGSLVTSTVRMSGPATFVFSGEMDL